VKSAPASLLSAEKERSNLVELSSTQPVELVAIERNQNDEPDESRLLILDESHSQLGQRPSEGDRNSREIHIFFSTFLTILLAELGDKTQLATLLMSAESQSPWTVFLGAGSALIATSLLGVLVGCWLARCVSPKTLETASGAILLLVSVLLLWDVVHI
jgi:putative Ca2+/H+ antiporter (TMEM165/GDT1 family)